MQGHFSQEDVKFCVGGEKVDCVPFTKEDSYIPPLTTAFIIVNSSTGSVKIPLSQEIIKELKEKGFI